MAREIKFRAWDRINKIMTYNPINAINFEGQILLNDGKFYDIDKTDYILMQYTGLKDKNDKEVYEGDIIHFSKYNQKHNESDQGIGIVKFDEFDYLYGLRLEDCKQIKPKPSGFFRGLGDLGSCEIIGNIYEHKYLLDNPELIGGGNG